MAKLLLSAMLLLDIQAQKVRQEKEKAFRNVQAWNQLLTFSHVNVFTATPSILLAMQEGGASLIELGVPYTDPQADGPTIRYANQVALERGTNDVTACLQMLKKAREMGLTIPVIMMGYYNPFQKHGTPEELCRDAKEAGADGFIMVDLPPEEGLEFNKACAKYHLSNIPLIAPTTSDERIAALAKTASTFLYCVSVTGVTGCRDELPADLSDFIARVRKHTELPLAVGFGVSNPQMVNNVANIADGVVVGSAIVKALKSLEDDGTVQEQADAVKEVVEYFCSGLEQSEDAKNQATKLCQNPTPSGKQEKGRFGKFGGQYICETLETAFAGLEQAYKQMKDDRSYIEELKALSDELIGGASPLQVSGELTKLAGGATIWIRHEDATYSGSNKIHNALGQTLLAKRLGLKRIVAEAPSASHGVAVATACARLDMECTIYVGSHDLKTYHHSVQKMTNLGAHVVVIPDGTLKEAMNEALCDVVTNVANSYYLVGDAMGPHPIPSIVRDFQSVIGNEIKQQFCHATGGKLPDAIVASRGRASNAMGTFFPFLDHKVSLHVVEGAGKGLDVEGGHCAVLSKGTMGVYHGCSTRMLQDENGQTLKTQSIAPGLNYPAVAPELAHLHDIGRVQVAAVTDEEALKAFHWMSKNADFVPSMEGSHAIYEAIGLAKKIGPGKNVVVSVASSCDRQ